MFQLLLLTTILQRSIPSENLDLPQVTDSRELTLFRV